MGQFIYFLPGAPGASPESLAAIGLGHVGPVASGRIDRGADGKAGTLVRSNADGAGGRLGFNDLLAWRPEPQRRWWLGFDEAAPPGPDDLLRRTGLVAGLDVTLADGGAWHCPTARMADGTCRLPMRVGLDAEGNDTFNVLDTRRHLWELTTEAWEHAMADAMKAGGEGEGGKMTFGRAVEIAGECVATNYRVGLTEIKALGLLTTANASEVLSVLIDWEGFLEMAKAAGAAEEGGGDPGEGKKNGT